MPNARRKPREGAALLIALAVIFVTSLLTVQVLDTTTLDLSAVRNSIDYDRALFLANAGVHAAAAQLEASKGWRGTVAEGTFPADGTYTATAVGGSQSGTVVVTSQGAAGAVVRTVVATFEI
ncbi:MAG: hypothetical protein KDA61_22485 [Planctomycetales bacterium]|nr:hypothetical protein [Planctomycetales bacterium]